MSKPNPREWEDPTADEAIDAAELLSLVSVEEALEKGNAPAPKAVRELNPQKVARLNATVVSVLSWRMIRKAISAGVHATAKDANVIPLMALGVKAAKDAQDRIYGKPVQPLAGAEGGALEIRVRYVDREGPAGEKSDPEPPFDSGAS